MKKLLQAILISVFVLLPALVGAQTVRRAPTTPVAVPGEIVVRVPGGMTRDAVDLLATQHGCEVIRPIPYQLGYYLFGIKGRSNVATPETPSGKSKQIVETLANKPGVVASPNWMRYLSRYDRSKGRTRTEPAADSITPNDPLYTQQRWHYEMIRMPEAWFAQVNSTGRPVKIGIVDSGIDLTHPDFNQASILQKDFTGDGLGDDVDPIVHGTHVAGTMAAVTNNGVGVAGIAGWNRGGVQNQIISGRMFGAGGASGTVAAEIAAFGFCVVNGAQVINMSLGGLALGAPDPTEAIPIQDAIQAGVIVVAAKGNSGIDLDGVIKNYPSDIAGVISVSAIGPTGRISSYSNFGNNLTIAAPGGDGTGGTNDVMSTVPVSAGSYAAFAGTSMASPHVAGVCALLLAAGATPTDILPGIPGRLSILLDSAMTPVDGDDPKHYGAGIVDAYSALAQLLKPSIRLVGPGDRGTTYFQSVPIQVAIRGVHRIITGSQELQPGEVRDTDLTVEIQAIARNSAPTVLRGGRNGAGDFEIPVPGANDTKGTVYTVSVPRDRPILVGPNQQYRITSKLLGVDTAVQFITTAQKIMHKGRGMFALPFKARLTGTGTPELDILGSGVSFGIARFNPLRLPNEDDYSRFRSNGSIADSGARFLIPNYNGPLTYDTALPAQSVAPVGIGYWIDLDRDALIDTTLLPAPGAASESPIVSSAVGIRAFAAGGGWNMIGAPFTFAVDWGAVTIQADEVNYSLSDAVAAGIISPGLVGYLRGDYVFAIAPAGQLEPFQGYWVRVFRDCTIIVPPAPSSGGTTRGVGAPLPKEGWSVRLAVYIAGDRDGQNYFGQARNAAETVDRTDILKPPAGAGHAYVRFDAKTSTGQTRALAYDMRPLTEKTGRQEWLASVTSDRPNADVTLTWEGVRNVPRRSKLKMMDLANGQTVVLSARSSYTYRSGEAGGTRQFKIILEPGSTAGPLAFTNVQVSSAGRSGAAMSVRFTTNQEADIVGVVQTITGKRIASLSGVSRAASTAETALRWDGRGQDGNPIPAGPYIIEVQARTADGQTAKFHRTVQIVR